MVIPVYNSMASLEPLVQRLTPVLAESGGCAEVIFVNDGSREATEDRITSLIDQFDGVRGINVMRNSGQHNAVLCGIRAACSEIVVTMDDDLQHPPEEIPHLLTKPREA